MPVLDDYARVPTSRIKILRDERQRTEIDTTDLDDSIREHGVINPIIITRDFVLVAGERRHHSSVKLGLPDIPVRFYEDLDPGEVQVIELIENLKRKDIPWRDYVKAIAKLHSIFQGRDPEWSMTATAKSLSVSPAEISHVIRVSRDLDSPFLAQATSFSAAYNVLTRRDERLMADTLSDILETGQEILEPQTTTIEPTGKDEGLLDGLVMVAPSPPRSSSGVEDDILNLSFLEWAPAYSGPRFNFLHCDFPYGIGLGDSGKWSGKTTSTMYDDSPDTYWALCRALAENLDRIMAPSAHLLFWFHMDHYSETLRFFERFAPSLAFQALPLIWHKTDNVGIMPDPKRGPRRVYETALIASRGDRLVVKSVSNAYGAPTDKAHHPSTKPEPVLRHFFQMFIDSGTKLLDPTCGGGSALRAAESMGAARSLGLELDLEHCTNARSALRQFRVLRNVTK